MLRYVMPVFAVLHEPNGRKIRATASEISTLEVSLSYRLLRKASRGGGQHNPWRYTFGLVGK